MAGDKGFCEQLAMEDTGFKTCIFPKLLTLSKLLRTQANRKEKEAEQVPGLQKLYFGFSHAGAG